MVEGHGIESCHGTAERSQEKVMVLLSVGAREAHQASGVVRGDIGAIELSGKKWKF